MGCDIEFGVCSICRKEKELQRTFYYYDLKCECHSPSHFEIIHHCGDCKPREPVETKLTVKVEPLKKSLIYLKEREDVVCMAHSDGIKIWNWGFGLSDSTHRVGGPSEIHPDGSKSWFHSFSFHRRMKVL